MATVTVSGTNYEGTEVDARFEGPYAHAEAFDFLMDKIMASPKVRVDGERQAWWLFELTCRTQIAARNAALQVQEAGMVVCL